jgi:hypothetical protein
MKGNPMAHLVETIVYVGAVPWHGLGRQLTAGQPIDVWAQQAGMDWQIRETPVLFMPESAGNRDTTIAFPDNKVLYRSDTHAPLAASGNGST